MTAGIQMPRWDLTPYFPSLQSPEFAQAQADFAANLEACEAYFEQWSVDKREGATDNDVQIFEGCMQRMDGLSREVRLLYAYANGHTDTDSRDEFAQAKLSEIENQLVRLSKLRTRFAAWIGNADKDALITSSQVARDHAYQLEKTFVAAQHLMGPQEEDLAAEMGMTGSNAWAKLHGNLGSQIEVTVHHSGSSRSIPIAGARNLAYDADPTVREAAYHAELAGWKANETAMAACMNSVKGEVLSLSKKRGWPSPLDAALFGANIDRTTLEAMLGAAHESFPIFRKYFRAKAKLVGQDGPLKWWNLFAPVASEGSNWSWDKATEFVEGTFRSFSDKMADFAARSFQESWIDAETRPGKRDGAYCMGTRNGESRILMNYKSSFGSVSTLAHELGHGYHNLCLKERTALQQSTPMTLAETASIFCETIIRHKGLEAADDQGKLNILEAAISGYAQVVVDITSRYMFETAVFESRAKRELSPTEFCEIMTDSQKATYGDGLDAEVLHPYMWAVKPHYYSSRSYYNFPYMFGLLFGIGLYAQYLDNADAFRANYDELLSSTGLADAATLASRFGIDIQTPDFWRGSLKVIEGEVNQFVELAGS